MIMTPEVIRDFSLFRCERMATTLSKKSCIRQYSITLAESIEDLKKLEVSTKWTNMDKRFSPCKGCHVGKAHYEGLETPEWKCQKCGHKIDSMGCINCNREKLISIQHRLAENPASTRLVSMIAKGIQQNCKRCGHVFNAHAMHGMYCSTKCKDANRKKRTRETPLRQLTCIECGKAFEGKKGTKICSNKRCSLDRIAKLVAMQRKVKREAKMKEMHLDNRKCTNPQCTNVYTSAITRRLFCDECMQMTRNKRQNIVRDVIKNRSMKCQ